MGLSSSKQKTSNDPWKPAQPYIIKNLKQQDDVFKSTQPQLEAGAAAQRATYGRIAPGAEMGIMGAQNLVNRNLSGANMQANPYLNAIMGLTREGVAGTVNDQFGPAGRFGSGMHNAILGREMYNAELGARMQDYNQERAYQQDAIGQAGNMMQGSQAILNNAAELPWIGVQAANGAVRQASSGYGTTTQTQSPGMGQMLMGAAMGGLNAYAMNPKAFSDRRLKRDIECIGLWDDKGDGLKRYRYSYKFDPDRTIIEGVMADEVEKLRPQAFIPNFRNGYDGVNYALLTEREAA